MVKQMPTLAPTASRVSSWFWRHLQTPLYRNAYALMASTGISGALGIVYWVLAARYYTPTQVGINATAVSAMMFLSGLAQLNFFEALPRFVPILGRQSAPLIQFAYITNIVLAGILGGGALFGLHLWNPVHAFLQTSPLFQGALIVVSMVWGVFALQDSILAGLRQSVWSPVIQTCFALLKLALLLLFARWLPDYGIFASWAIAMLAVIMPVNWMIFYRFIPRYATHYATSAPVMPFNFKTIWFMKFIAGNYIGYLFDLMTIDLLPLLIVSYAGARVSAHFYVPWTIAGAFNLAALYLATVMTAEAAKDPSNLNRYIWHTFVQLIRLFGTGSFIVVVLAFYGLHLFGADYAAAGTLLLRLLVVASIPYGINKIYLASARLRNDAIHVVGVQAILCLLVLGLSMLLLPDYGISGVGIAWLVSQSVVACATGWGLLKPHITCSFRFYGR